MYMLMYCITYLIVNIDLPLLLGPSHWETQLGVVVLSYPRYCRYRGVMKRLQGVEEEWLKTSMVVALGGFTCPWKNTRILFCKETFDYPELEGHELLCNHLGELFRRVLMLKLSPS